MGLVDKLLTHQTVVEVVFKDRLLGFLSLASALLLVGYVVVDMFVNNRHIAFEKPTIDLNMWVGDSFVPTNTSVPNPLPYFCNNATYDFIASAATTGFGASNISCEAVPKYAAVTMESRKISLLSFQQWKILESDGITIASTKNTFNTNLDVDFNIQHSARAIETSYTNVETTLLGGSGEIIKTFGTSNIVTLSFRDVLKAIQDGAGSMEGELDNNLENYRVKRRVTGMSLQFKLNYYNYKNGYGSKVFCEITVGRSEGLA